MKAPSVLQRIAIDVEARLRLRREKRVASCLRDQALKSRQPEDFKKAFAGSGPHIIAEVKFRSPSEGILMAVGGEVEGASPVEIAEGYLRSGAAALSILTEEDHFGGRLAYLRAIRESFPEAYLLMKDFVIDEEQLCEARINGADAVLLIIALLGEQRTRELHRAARDLGLSALVEVHDEQELEIASRLGADLIGVNNRDLKTLRVSLDVSRRLITQVPKGAVLVSESGLSRAADIKELSSKGYAAFLIGSSFMKTRFPGAALAELKKGLL